MANLTNSPLENSYEATLTQELAASAGSLTIFVSRVPSFTFPVGQKVRMTINPKKAFTLQEDVLIESYDSVAKTLTVSAGGRAQARYNGDAPTPLLHTVGSKIIISDPYGLWTEIQTAVNSKINTAGGTFTGPLDFSGATASFRIPNMTTLERDALTGVNGLTVYNTDTGTIQIFDGGVWVNIDIGSPPVVNASDTAAGIVQIATQAKTDAGDDVGSTLAKNALVPSRTANVIQNSKWTYATDTGIASAYVITLTPAPTAYATGQSFIFKAANTNGGASTLNVNGLGVTPIKKQNDQDLLGADIETGSIVTVVYDGTNFQMLSQTAQAPSVQEFDVVGTANTTIADQEALSFNGNTRLDLADANESLLNQPFLFAGLASGASTSGNPQTYSPFGPFLDVPTFSLTQRANCRLWAGQTQTLSNITTDAQTSAAEWRAQTFTPAVGEDNISAVIVGLTKTGAPSGTITARIRATTAGLPSGGDLVTATLSAIVAVSGNNTFNFATPLALTPGTVYALTIDIAGGLLNIGNNIAWNYQNTNPYAGGQSANSVDTGASWTAEPLFDRVFTAEYRGISGEPVFLSDTAGNLELTEGTRLNGIGYAVDTSHIILSEPRKAIVGSLVTTQDTTVSNTVTTDITIGFKPRVIHWGLTIAASLPMNFASLTTSGQLVEYGMTTQSHTDAIQLFRLGYNSPQEATAKIMTGGLFSGDFASSSFGGTNSTLSITLSMIDSVTLRMVRTYVLGTKSSIPTGSLPLNFNFHAYS